MKKIVAFLFVLIVLTQCAYQYHVAQGNTEVTELKIINSSPVISVVNNNLEPVLRVEFADSLFINLNLPSNVIRINSLYSESLEHIFALVTEKVVNKAGDEVENYNIYEFYFDVKDSSYKLNDWFGLGNVEGLTPIISLVVMDYENYVVYMMSDSCVYRFIGSWIADYQAAENERFAGMYRIKDSLILLIHSLNTEGEVQSEIVKFDSQAVDMERIWVGDRKIVNVMYDNQLGMILIDSQGELVLVGGL